MPAGLDSNNLYFDKLNLQTLLRMNPVFAVCPDSQIEKGNKEPDSSPPSTQDPTLGDTLGGNSTLSYGRDEGKFRLNFYIFAHFYFFKHAKLLYVILFCILIDINCRTKSIFPSYDCYNHCLH